MTLSTGGTFVLHGTTKTLTRPDLVVQQITPKQALVGTSFSLNAVIAERNGDVGATADVTLSAIPGSVEHVVVPAGGTATASFPVTFGSAVPVDVTATVTATGATPTETDVTNNAMTQTVDITRSQLASPFRVLFPSLLGYGAQFNGHLYAPITAPFIPPGEYADVNAKVKQLEPELVRIFYNDNWEENQDGTHLDDWQANYASFVQVAELAQESGATIDIGYQEPEQPRHAQTAAPGRGHDVAVRGRARGFVNNHGVTNLRWAEVANEPNSGAVTLDQYKTLCQDLKDDLVARGLGNQIQIMGGGLVENAGNPARDHYRG